MGWAGKFRRIFEKVKKVVRNESFHMLVLSRLDTNFSDVLLVSLTMLLVSSMESIGRVPFLCILVAGLLVLASRLEKRKLDGERELKRRLEMERSFNTLETPKESAFWLNKFVGTYWNDAIEPLLADVFYKTLNKMIEKGKPSFIKSIIIDSFTLGTNQPRVDNFRILGNSDRNKDVKSLEFDVFFTADDFRWVLRAVGSDEIPIIRGKNFTFSIVSLEIRLRVRMYLFNSSNIGLLSLVQKPDIYTFHANLFGISQRAIPFFDIRKFLESVISQALVEPKRVPVSLSFKKVPEVGDSKIFFDIVDCSGIKIIDRSVTRKLQLKVSIGPYKRKGKVVEGENPVFNDRFEATFNNKKLKIKIKLLDVTDNAGSTDAWECIGEKTIEMMCSQKDTTTFWLKDPAGLPLCRTLQMEDKSWKVDCPLESGKSVTSESGDFGHISLILYPVVWKYFEGDDYVQDTRSRSRSVPYSYALRVSRARNLMAKDSNGLSDPYFKVKYGAFTARSATVFRNLNPVWSETFVFERNPTVDTIKIKIWDKDKIQDESLGQVDIPVRLVHQGAMKFSEWRELKGADSGEIHYELSLRKGLPTAVRNRGITVNDEIDRLYVMVHRARHLKGVDRGKTSDPYCTVEFNGTVRKSKVIKKSTDPVWDFSSNFEIGLGSKSTQGSGEIYISIYDWNMVLSRKLLGFVSINVNDVHRGMEEKWHQLKDAVSGEVLLTVRKHCKSQAAAQAAAQAAVHSSSPASVDWSDIKRALF
ncbi:C2 domain-containing protein [Chloropicon primus]|uniref:C2 domain-containing protein n=1 Tax=Chloropicon primus TaxID=1764295 RepID=A0A5B8MXK4_9CHLO|nr:C2 domain-containing protein [Chloropicon primus]UPR04290.1 C2 domain-containing protein [Chloropicon primus]|eukprot:QDZ25081.1 C2 domain-containing protein [Chloropicon primus]